MKVVSVIFLLLGVVVFGQTNSSVKSSILDRVEDSSGPGEVKIYQDSQIAFMLELNIENNRKHKGIDGFRIHIYSGSSRKSKEEAFEVKSKLLSYYPEEFVYVEYNAPFWRVRVGDYRTKSESLPLLNKLKKYFPNCYTVKDSEVDMRRLPWPQENEEKVLSEKE